ncbi:unnamed protein product, partial [Staurois parvus]
METAAMGGRTGTHEGDSGPRSSMRRRYRGAHEQIMQHRYGGPIGTGAPMAAAMGGRKGTHETLWTWQQH